MLVNNNGGTLLAGKANLTNEVTMTNEVTTYEEMLKAQAVEAAKGERPLVSSISLQSGQITYGGNPIPGNSLDCIIAASTHANFFYDKKWKPDTISAPACYAYSATGKGMKPHPTSTNPQHETCEGCPNNEWGSAAEGDGKACKNQRVLALVTPDGGEEVAILKVPVTSVKNYSDYVNKVSTLFSRSLNGLITTISAEPHKKTQFKLNFSNGPLLDATVGAPILARLPRLIPLIERVYEVEDEAPEKARKM